jgi:hypothetical protein
MGGQCQLHRCDLLHRSIFPFCGFAVVQCCSYSPLISPLEKGDYGGFKKAIIYGEFFKAIRFLHRACPYVTLRFPQSLACAEPFDVAQDCFGSECVELRKPNRAGFSSFVVIIRGLIAAKRLFTAKRFTNLLYNSLHL